MKARGCRRYYEIEIHTRVFYLQFSALKHCKLSHARGTDHGIRGCFPEKHNALWIHDKSISIVDSLFVGQPNGIGAELLVMKDDDSISSLVNPECVSRAYFILLNCGAHRTAGKHCMLQANGQRMDKAWAEPCVILENGLNAGDFSLLPLQRRGNFAQKLLRRCHFTKLAKIARDDTEELVNILMSMTNDEKRQETNVLNLIKSSDLTEEP